MPRSFFAGKPVDPRAALSVAREDRGEGGKHDRELALQGPWRIDHDEAATVQPVGRAGATSNSARRMFWQCRFRSARQSVGPAPVLIGYQSR